MFQIDEGRGISGATLHTPEHTIANHQLWFLNSRTKDYSISQCVVLCVQCDSKNSTARNRRDSLTAGSSGVALLMAPGPPYSQGQMPLLQVLH